MLIVEHVKDEHIMLGLNTFVLFRFFVFQWTDKEEFLSTLNS